MLDRWCEPTAIILSRRSVFLHLLMAGVWTLAFGLMGIAGSGRKPTMIGGMGPPVMSHEVSDGDKVIAISVWSPRDRGSREA